METFVHQLISGLATGGIYASIALALVMIYQATHLVNFAQGEMAMFSTYGAWTLIEAGFPYWEAFAITLAASFLAGVLLERLVVRPVAKRSDLAVVVVFIGLLVIFNSVAGWIWTYSVKTYPTPFSAEYLPGNKYITSHEIGSLLIMLVELAALYVFFRFTSLGLAMRAAAYNPVSSRLLGVRVDLMLALGWGLSAAIGAVAGMMVAHMVYLDPNMMTGILLYGFAGALLGGIDSPGGAVVGGFLLGVLENMLGAYVIGTDLKLSVALVVIVAVLTVKPSGLFGKTIASRV
ncbi:MAG: branched-chain amino acid ABC transporter permease [Xanthobacteraceae bacterium]